jgi:hypothetical protein
MTEPINIYELIKETVGDLGKVVRIGERSGSMGSAQIARSIFEGRKDILGIPVRI